MGINIEVSNILEDRAMAQAVSRRPLTAVARICTRVNLCGICGRQSSTGTGFSPSYSVFPVNIISLFLPCSYIIWGLNDRPVSGRSSET
jgi:hypothetical protein